MIDRIPEERRGGTALVARPGAPDGEVRAALLADQFAEAAFVADQVVQAHETGLPDGTWPEWRDVAVLVRSKRLLGPLREALEQRGVPVEVVGLSGLLETPEIVDLVSTLRVVADPGPTWPWPGCSSAPAGGSVTATSSAWPAGRPGTTGASRTSCPARTPTRAT